MYLSLARSKTRTQRIARINHQSASSRIPDSHLTCPTKPRERRCCSTCSTNRWRQGVEGDVSRDFETSKSVLKALKWHPQIFSCRSSSSPSCHIMCVQILANPIHPKFISANPIHSGFKSTTLRQNGSSAVCVRKLPPSTIHQSCSLWCHPFCLSRPHSLSRALAAVKAFEATDFQSCIRSPDLCCCSSFS